MNIEDVGVIAKESFFNPRKILNKIPLFLLSTVAAFGWYLIFSYPYWENYNKETEIIIQTEQEKLSKLDILQTEKKDKIDSISYYRNLIYPTMINIFSPILGPRPAASKNDNKNESINGDSAP